MGIEEYLSQSNDNVDFLFPKEKYKFKDDLSVLELINMISIGLASYNCHNHVPSDIATDNSYLDLENIRSQGYLNKIVKWR